MSHKESDTKSSNIHYTSNPNQSIETDEQDELNNYYQIGEVNDDTENEFFDAPKEYEINIKLSEEEEKKESEINFVSLSNIETNQNKKDKSVNTENKRSLIGKKRLIRK